MASNKAQKQSRSLLDEQRDEATRQYQSALQTVRAPLVNQALPESYDLRNQIRGQYTDISKQNFMPPGLVPNAEGWFNLPGGGGGTSYDSSGFESGYKKFADTGSAGDFEEALRNWRGLGFNSEALRQRATSVIPAFYGQYKNALQRRSAVQGGYSPGYDEQMAELGREQARQGFGASRDVEAEIAERQAAVDQAKASGITNIAQLIQSGKLAGLGGLKDIAGTRASLGDAASARNLAAQLELAGMYQKGSMTGALEGASGLSNLYRSAPGDVGQLLDAYGGFLSNMTGGQLQNLLGRSQIQDRSWLDYLPGLIGAGGSLLSAFGGMGGGGGSSWGLPGQQIPMNRLYNPSRR